MSFSSSGTTSRSSSLEVAQKRLALEQEKLQVDKQLVRAEKKHLKVLQKSQQEELQKCHKKIQLLEKQLFEKQNTDAVVRELEEKLQQSMQMEHDLEELQTQLHHDADSHEAVVGEMELKIQQQQQEIERLHQQQSGGAGLAISPSKASSNKAEIQQYKNKLQSLRLAMEVAVRRTETEWKQKVDELEVQMATQEGEFEDLLEQKTEELGSEISHLQQQLEYCEKSHADERNQLEGTIEKLQQTKGYHPNDEISVAQKDQLGKTKDELRSLQKKRAESLKKQHVVVKEARDLIDQIQSTTESDDLYQVLVLLKTRAETLDMDLNALEGRTSTSKPMATRKISRKSSRNEKKLHNVQEMEWSGSNQKGTYSGYVSDDKHEPHGRGILKVENGDVYEGEWKQGRRHGQGKEKRVGYKFRPVFFSYLFLS